MTRRLPEFEPGEAVVEAVQPEQALSMQAGSKSKVVDAVKKQIF